MKGVGLAGAAALPGGALFASEAAARSSRITSGDGAILRFLSAAEQIESDLWTQYNELGGVNGGRLAYMAALENLDGDMPQYIADNTDDEISHVHFLNRCSASPTGAASSGTANRSAFGERLGRRATRSSR